MGLEAATYINQLVQTNPTSIDSKSQGDDHFRLIKSVLKNTFPNITGEVTMTQAQLNKVGDNTLYCFPGMIVMWSGTIANIPSGWKLCNGVGTISTGGAVPDLRNRFVVGAGQTYGVNATGGSATSTVSDSTSVATNLQVTVQPTGWGATGGAPGDTRGGATGGIQYGRMVVGSGSPESSETLESLRAAGSSQTFPVNDHSHTFSGTVSNIPPYYALAFIIKN